MVQAIMGAEGWDFIRIILGIRDRGFSRYSFIAASAGRHRAGNARPIGVSFR